MAAIIGVALGTINAVTAIATKNSINPGMKNSMDAYYDAYLLFTFSLDFINQVHMRQHMFATAITI